MTDGLAFALRLQLLWLVTVQYGEKTGHLQKAGSRCPLSQIQQRFLALDLSCYVYTMSTLTAVQLVA
jgi:hypothetical protein